MREREGDGKCIWIISSHDKNSPKCGHRGNISQCNKSHLGQTHSWHNIQQWKAESLPSKFRNKTRMPTLTTSILFFFFFWPHCTVCGILVHQPGNEPGPQQWKHWVLTTGLPGNSLTTSIQHSTGSPSHSNQTRKRNKRYTNWKGRGKTVTICRWHDSL